MRIKKTKWIIFMLVWAMLHLQPAWAMDMLSPETKLPQETAQAAVAQKGLAASAGRIAAVVMMLMLPHFSKPLIADPIEMTRRPAEAVQTELTQQTISASMTEDGLEGSVKNWALQKEIESIFQRPEVVRNLQRLNQLSLKEALARIRALEEVSIEGEILTKVSMTAGEAKMLAEILRLTEMVKASPVVKLLVSQGILELPREHIVSFIMSDGSISVTLPTVEWSQTDIPSLKELLKNGHPDYRQAAARVLESLQVKQPSKTDQDFRIEQWIQRLSDENYWVHQEAIEAIVSLGPSAIPSLVKALRDQEWRIHRGATEALKRIGGAQTVEALVGSMSDPDWNVRDAVQEIFFHIGQPVVPFLVQRLDDSDRETQKVLIAFLGEMRVAQAVEKLLVFLKDPEDWTLRLDVIIALGKIGDPQAISPLVQILQDPEAGERLEAAEALGEMKAVPAVEALIEALQDEDEFLRQAAVTALGKIKDPRAVKPLIPLLMDPIKEARLASAQALLAIAKEGLIPEEAKGRLKQALVESLQDPDWEVRVEAAKALWQFTMEPQAIEILIEALWEPDDHGVRQSARGALVEIGRPIVERLIKELESPAACIDVVYILGEIGDERAIHPLIDVMEGYRQLNDEAVSAQAAIVLGKMKATQAVKLLIGALQDSHDLLRRAAAWALGEIKDPRAVEPLIEMAKKERNWYPLVVAIEALGKIGDPRAAGPLRELLSQLRQNEDIVWPNILYFTINRTLHELEMAQEPPVLKSVLPLLKSL